MELMISLINISKSVTTANEEAIYERPLFIILVSVLLFVIYYLYSRNKTKKAELKDKEKQQLINEMCNVFAKCVDSRDIYNIGHSNKVAMYSVLIAEKMGKDKSYLEKIRNIGLLHDIGKIGIPDRILNKPEALDDQEYNIMKSHANIGYNILKDIKVSEDLAIGAGYHHEHIDGSGYPRGLKGDQIPEYAQIIAVADTFDAMRSDRPYRKGMEMEEIEKELERVAGTQLNKDAVEALLELIREGKI